MDEPISLQLEYRDDRLVVRTQGRDILERTEPTIRAIATALRDRPVRTMLLDLSNVPGSATFLDRYQLGATAGRHLPRLPIAVVTTEELADPKRIGQLAAQNRGVDVMVFTDLLAAESWLESRTGSAPR